MAHLRAGFVALYNGGAMPIHLFPRHGVSFQPASRAARLASVVVLFGALLLAGCAFHGGGDTIAFLRDGQLWSINPDGSGVAILGRGGVLGFAWSPDHHQVVYRAGSGAFASSTQLAAPDAPGTLNVTSADGGGTVTITPASTGLARGDAWWDADGNRLVYRESLPALVGQLPNAPLYVLSQADQPVGIARVFLQGAGSLPAVAPDGSRVAWVDAAGGVHLGKPGTSGQVIAARALRDLPGGARPARLLWQPGHQALLYDTLASGGQIGLVLSDLSGHGRTLGIVSGLLDEAFSPDGSLLLVRTATAFAVWRVGASAPVAPIYTWDESDPYALAWWSPDGHFVLVRDQAGLALADLRAGTTRALLTSAAPAAVSGSHAGWRPLAGSPWSPDGTRIVFADPGTSAWQGHALPAPKGGGGLYVATINAGGQPQLIASGPIAWPGWSYLDPSVSVLVAS